MGEQNEEEYKTVVKEKNHMTRITEYILCFSFV